MRGELKLSWITGKNQMKGGLKLTVCVGSLKLHDMKGSYGVVVRGGLINGCSGKIYLQAVQCVLKQLD